MSVARIYHNPRCSKSRQALALIEEQGEAPEIIDYIKTPLDNASISELLTMLDMSARDLMRKKEDTYKELNLNNPELSEAQLVQALADYPRLIERPIVVRNGQAVLARPPEKVLELFA
ncbi:arsenate reductase (glutaredoxin) [uncultured Halopseudomonas sp.]|jgi:arsenate reductase|uniref:arsenate reductase (glutaredoxin) n=1 Tax=uncultured Halopseudomonas sp. TaxID=2901193 RepID=UPI0030EB78F3|tara:strand:+ start:42011 stop:42364 length:354 start_codon:yes stop_codon:yes gene_type:complete